jgi:hypothetical protein
VVLDGAQIATYTGVLIAPRFTLDGRRLAYVAGHGSQLGVTRQTDKVKPVLGGLEGKEYDQMLTWRADGQTFGFTLDEKGVLHGIAVRDGEVLCIELEIVKK